MTAETTPAGADLLPDLSTGTRDGWAFVGGMILGDAVMLASVLRLVLDTTQGIPAGIEAAARAAIKAHNETVAAVEEWREGTT